VGAGAETEGTWANVACVLDTYSTLLSQLSEEQKNNLRSLTMQSSKADRAYFMIQFEANRAKLFPKLKAFLDLLQALPMFPDTKDRTKRTTSQKHSTYRSLAMAAMVENDVMFIPSA
jgi:hypothetical protein